jgi:hypothetical protein
MSPGVTALTGILVPDTTAPSFTRSAVLSATRSTAQPGRFTVQMDLGLNEQGRVYYALYGHPSCITGEHRSVAYAARLCLWLLVHYCGSNVLNNLLNANWRIGCRLHTVH